MKRCEIVWKRNNQRKKPHNSQCTISNMATVDVSTDVLLQKEPQDNGTDSRKRKAQALVGAEKEVKKTNTRRSPRGRPGENSEDRRNKVLVSLIKSEDQNNKLLVSMIKNMIDDALEPMKNEIDSIKSKVRSDVTPEKTLPSRARTDLLTAGTEKAYLDHLTVAIKKFVREKFFSVLKFADKNKARIIVLQAERDNRIQPMQGQPKEHFYEQCTQLVLTAFNTIRGYMQSQARKNFLSKTQCCCLPSLFFDCRINFSLLTADTTPPFYITR